MNISKKFLLPLTISSVFFTHSVLASDDTHEKAQKEKDGAQKSYQEVKGETKEAWKDTKEGAKETWADVKKATKSAWENTQDAYDEGIIAGKLETAIILNSELNPFAIDFEIHGQAVTLEGEVDSEITKELAENIALGVDGVESVENKIKVNKEYKNKSDAVASDENRNFSQYVDDVSTTAAIKTEFIANGSISGLDINVDTFRDEVTLSGEVKSNEQKALAEAIVKKRNGVTKVVNLLEVDS